MTYEFTEAKAVRWIERIGVDVRPPIEIRLEEERFQTFSKKARKEFPQLFDRMVLGDQQFEMLKTLAYPGKSEVEVRTFVMTPRGPVIAFPRRIPEIDLEPDLPEANSTFVTCMKRFLECFPSQKIIRVGKVNEYVFECGEINSLRLVSDRFVNMQIPETGEVRIRANLRTADYNRIFTIEPVKQMRQTGPYSPPEETGFGVKVTADFNNCDLDKEMGEAGWLTVLNSADLFFRDEMYGVLNGGQSEDLG